LSKTKKPAKEQYVNKIKIGPPRLTKYERARIIGARALQLTMGAPPLIPPEMIDSSDPLEIAEKELKMKILPITIRRRLPTGEYQDIPLKWLLEAEESMFGS